MIATKLLELMESIHYSEEKACALTGFTLAIGRNSAAMEKRSNKFLFKIAQYNQENEEDKEN
jgi:hypothetical protein